MFENLIVKYKIEVIIRERKAVIDHRQDAGSEQTSGFRCRPTRGTSSEEHVTAINVQAPLTSCHHDLPTPTTIVEEPDAWPKPHSHMQAELIIDM